MSPRVDKARLAELATLAAEATPGDWGRVSVMRAHAWGNSTAEVHVAPSAADAALIAAAGCSLGDVVADLTEAREAMRQADGLLRRLSKWDVMNPTPRTAWPSDAPYWQAEIARARAVLGNAAAVSARAGDQP